MLNAIVAVDENYGIGYNNQLLEHIPEDLKNFKFLTMDNTVIMGRKTYDSLPKRPLEGRLNIVITRQEIPNEENVLYMTKQDVDSWIKANRNLKEIFIIGGESIYDLYLPICDRVYLTKIYKTHANVDSYFCNLDLDSSWRKIPTSSKREFKDTFYQFWTYERL